MSRHWSRLFRAAARFWSVPRVKCVRVRAALRELAAKGSDRWRALCSAQMDAPQLDALIPIIQVSTTPVILMSGMGLLLLTMTNRMARITDRTRLLAAQLRDGDPEQRQLAHSQLEIMWQRAKIVRLALTAATASMLMSSALIVVIFVSAVFRTDSSVVMLALFSAAILLLVAALIAFLRDIFVSLAALKLEVRHAQRK